MAAAKHGPTLREMRGFRKWRRARPGLDECLSADNRVTEAACHAAEARRRSHVGGQSRHAGGARTDPPIGRSLGR